MLELVLVAPAIEVAQDWTSLLLPLGGGGVGVGICFMIARQLWKLYTEGLREENARIRKDYEAERSSHEETKESRKKDIELLYRTQVENAHLRVMLAGLGVNHTPPTPPDPPAISSIHPPAQLEPPNDTNS